MELTMENYGTMEKKLWYYGQNYGTILRTIELRFKKKKTWGITITKKLTMEKLWYYGQNYGTIPKTMEL